MKAWHCQFKCTNGSTLVHTPTRYQGLPCIQGLWRSSLHSGQMQPCTVHCLGQTADPHDTQNRLRLLGTDPPQNRSRWHALQSKAVCASTSISKQQGKIGDKVPLGHWLYLHLGYSWGELNWKCVRMTEQTRQRQPSCGPDEAEMAKQA